MAIHLEPLDPSGLEFIRSLRNANRQWFFHSEPIDYKQHLAWYRKYLDSFNLFWVIWYEGVKVGSINRKFIKWTRDGWPIYEIGNLMILPAYRKHGLMLDAMQMVTSLDKQAFYVAQVKPNNRASLALFKRAGFWRVPKSKRKRSTRATR